MTSTRWVWRLMALIALGWLGAGSDLVRAADLPITRNVALEALQEAVRWPNPAPQAVLTLAGQFMASRRDHEGYTFFQERATSQPDQPLWLALEGFFQARLAAQVPLLQRGALVDEALAKLDRAVSHEPYLTRYFRGTVLAQLPTDLGKAAAAVADLEWVLQHQERFAVGFRRSVYRALAQAYTTLGREKEAHAALERSGYPSLDPTHPLFTTNYRVTAKEGFRFGPPRFVELAPRVYVAQGYDFADFACVLTDDGIVAIDAGTTETNARAVRTVLHRISPQSITHLILTHAHWDHIGGLAGLQEPDTQVIAQARFADELRRVNETGVGFRFFWGGGTTTLRGHPGSPHQ